MSLAEIASSMKIMARRDGKTESRLAHGAHLRLDYAHGETVETFLLTITRAGKAPHTERQVKAWRTELNTFARYFVPINTPHTFPTPPPAPPYMYNAQIQWHEPLPLVNVETTDESAANDSTPAPRYDNSLPRTPDEIAAWAKTLGPGIKITGVNVFTGELPATK